MDGVYEISGTIADSRPHAGGPWDPTMQHGSAPAALAAWAVERLETRVPMQVVRLSIDLLKPVPVEPLEVRAEVIREGRKIQTCAVSLLANGTEVVRASALKMRIAELEPPVDEPAPPLGLPLPEGGMAPEPGVLGSSPFVSGVEMRVVKGSFRQPGPAAVWFRARRPIVAGMAMSPLMRAAVAADFCNGTSAVVDVRQWTFLNGDLTINLARQPVGEWILLDAETWLGDGGSGIAFGRLADEKGYFGRAAQSILLERR